MPNYVEQMMSTNDNAIESCPCASRLFESAIVLLAVTPNQLPTLKTFFMHPVPVPFHDLVLSHPYHRHPVPSSPPSLAAVCP